MVSLRKDTNEARRAGTEQGIRFLLRHVRLDFDTEHLETTIWSASRVAWRYKENSRLRRNRWGLTSRPLRRRSSWPEGFESVHLFLESAR